MTVSSILLLQRCVSVDGEAVGCVHKDVDDICDPVWENWSYCLFKSIWF